MEILQKVSGLKAELDTYRPLDKDQEAAIMQKFRLDWNFHSNHLEGNSLSYGETKALILFGITAAGKPLKDHFEITGHDEAVKWVEEVVKEERPLTESFIRELHKLILKESYESKTITKEGLPATRTIQVGEYKSTPNHVLTPTGEIFRFATPEETPARMHDLIKWYREKENDSESHPLLAAAEFHYKFIRIHPFDDGNGRTVRILMNFILMKNGYPPVVVKTEDKANYFAALRQADAGLIEPFIEYIGKNLEHSLDLMIRGAKGEFIGDEDDVDKEIALIEQKLKKVNKGVELIKSEEAIYGQFDKSVYPLIKYFFEECKKFDKLYEKIRLIIRRNEKTGYDFSYSYVRFDKVKQLTFQEGETKTIYIDCYFDRFAKKGIEYFNYESQIVITFKKNLFEIKNKRKNVFIKKMYHELLAESEIKNLVRSETKAHTDFINQQIEKVQSQKTQNP